VGNAADAPGVMSGVRRFRGRERGVSALLSCETSISRV
jgi:hypothetical protein